MKKVVCGVCVYVCMCVCITSIMKLKSQDCYCDVLTLFIVV